MTGRVTSSEREREEVRVEREESEREGREKGEREVGKRPSQRELRAQTTTDTFLSRRRRENLLM